MHNDVRHARGSVVLDYKQPIETGSIPDDGTDFDVIVVGGGPGGSAAAAYNAMNGCKVLLIEKDVWPRDKVCGDAVGGKSLSHAKELGVLQLVDESPLYVLDSIIFGSANGSEVRVMLPKEAYEAKGLQSGYALPRQQFDWLMFYRGQQIVRENGGFVLQGFSVLEVTHETSEDGPKITGVRVKSGGLRGEGDELAYTARVTIGAGGYNCPVARTMVSDIFEEPFRDDEHFCGGYREYWEGVDGFEGDEGPIEIHFIDEVLPGYFWLFPVRDGLVNVGIGMLISEQRKQKGRKKSLKKIQDWVIKEHPRFKQRFTKAKMLEGSAKGWQLPFGSPRRNPSSFQPRRSAMAGAMTVGDAASLVDPFSGEGIGNALLTAKMTSAHFDRIAHSQGFPETAADEYMRELWGTLGKELSNSTKLQRMMKWKRLTNWFVKRASKKPEIGEMMSEMIASKEAQKKLWSPWFLFKTIVLP